MERPLVVDRSRIEAWQKCPRSRWWGYEYEGRGLQSAQPVAALEIGKAVHAGIACLLREASMPNIELAVAAACGGFRDVTVPTAAIVDNEGQPQDVEEALALIEALVRAWAAVRLPAWLQEYEVVAVEREEILELGPNIIFLARPDALVSRKADSSPMLVNFKTVSDPNKTWRDQWRYDMQTLSEVLPVEARVGEKLAGVIVEGLAKGKRLESRDKTFYYHNSPLIWPWKKSGEAPFTADEFSGRYEWDDPATGKSHRLGKGWTKVPVWKEPGGVKHWLDLLLSTDRALVEEQFVTLPPVLRSEWEIEEWKEATVDSEWRIRAGAKLVHPTNEVGLSSIFPRHTSHGNCIRPGRCQFFELCWGIAAADPLGCGLYGLRAPNHEFERRMLCQEDEHDAAGVHRGPA